MGRSGGFAPVTLPLFQGTRFWGVGGAHSLDPAWSYSSVTEDEKHVPRALESGQLSGHCGLRIRSSGERPRAIDPFRTLALGAAWACMILLERVDLGPSIGDGRQN